MAYKKYNHDGPSAEDRALELFGNLMEEKIKSIKEDWHKPWFSPQSAQLPKNLDGRQYNGMNSIILMLMQEKNGWQTSRYATFDRIASLNYAKDAAGNRKPAVDKDGNELPRVSINKGEHSTPVMLTTFTVVNKDTRERIKYDDYKNLTDEEKNQYVVYPNLKVFNVFNIAQTNLKDSRPEMYQKFMDEANGQREANTEKMTDFPALDAMIEKDLYVCPIRPTEGDQAFYNVSKDVIVVPLKSQFDDGESFYSNLLHEMSHASGAVNRLNRLTPGASFGSEAYAKEELVAELTAALVSSQYGLEKHIKEDSAAYLKSWLSTLHEDPSFIKNSLMDVKRSASFISERLDAVDLRLKRDGWEADFSDIREKNKAYAPTFTKQEKPTVAAQESQSIEQEPEEKQEQKEEVAAKEVQRSHFRR